MVKRKKELSREKKHQKMINAIGHYAMWREMECPVRIIGVANPVGLREGNVEYKGIREIIDQCGTPIIPNEKILKEKHVYIVELPEPIDIETPDGEKKVARALFLPRRDLSSPIHPDKVEKIEKENNKKEEAE